MNKIYIKGLINKKKLLRMMLILFLVLSLFIFLIAYKNDINKKIYDEKNQEYLRTVSTNNNKIDYSKYDEYIENYECDEENNCVIIFKTFILKDNFLDKYGNEMGTVNQSLGMQSQYSTLLNILKIGTVVIMVILILCIIAFIINYISYILKTIKLYHILGYSIFKSLTYLDLLFFVLLECYSIIIMVTTKIINANYILYEDFVLMFVIISASCLTTSLISRLIVKKAIIY